MNGKKRLYVFDLDGTLANLDHRLPFISGQIKNWDAFFDACSEDKPIEWVVDFSRMLRYSPSAFIGILSGRSARVRGATLRWLENNGVAFDILIMRPEGDRRPDEVLKLELLQKMLKQYDFLSLQFIVDDRQRVVDMWRRNGFNCLQCNAWEE